ncbi:MAG: polysaccharide deacetylase family protein [Armatimonadetes bacterium]|nr:polysaccharide deacetylase family protein [Armatimonadota bacterium]
MRPLKEGRASGPPIARPPSRLEWALPVGLLCVGSGVLLMTWVSDRTRPGRVAQARPTEEFATSPPAPEKGAVTEPRPPPPNERVESPESGSRPLTKGAETAAAEAPPEPAADSLAGIPASAPAASSRIGWTTDVGPDAPTDVAVAMLEQLAVSGVRCTFFVTGQFAERHPEVVKRMVAEGHHLGNHTYTHPSLPALGSEAAIRSEIATTEARLLGLVDGAAVEPKVFRPPYGDCDGRTERAVAALGYRLVMWDIDPIDWSEDTTSDQIVQRILSRAGAGKVVLTHVTPRTLRAMPIVFAGLRQRGLEPVPLRELAKYGAASHDGRAERSAP